MYSIGSHHAEPIGFMIVAGIALFIALVFWISYFRIRNNKLLITAVGFTLFLTKAIAHALDKQGPHMLLLDLFIIFFIALPLYLRSKPDEDEEYEDEPVPGNGVKAEKESLNTLGPRSEPAEESESGSELKDEQEPSTKPREKREAGPEPAEERRPGSEPEGW